MKTTFEEKTELIYNNLINIYSDYSYLISIKSHLNLRGIPIITNELKSYIRFLKHIIEMTQRDFVNNMYKLMYDGNGYNFREFLKDLNLYEQYKSYSILSNKQESIIKALRNKTIDHIAIDNYKSLSLEEIFPQVNRLIDIYNEIFDKKETGQKITINLLQEIDAFVKAGVNSMFDNECHHIIYL